jgi:hypothetical protein
MKNETIDLGNNESLSRGVFGPDADGMYTALTFSQSKRFKTLRGAKNWIGRKAAR